MVKARVCVYSLAWIAIASGAPILVPNGSFETGVKNINPFVTLKATDKASIASWVVSNGTVDYVGNYWQAANGDRSLDLNGDGPGAVYTDVNTSAGITYRVWFSMAGNPDGGPNVKTLMVKVGPQEFNNASFDITNIDGKGTKATRASMGWTDKYEDFTAKGNSSRIQFISTTMNSPYGPALDNVRLEQLDDAPEPSSWLLMLTGLGFVAVRWIPRGRC